MPCKVDLYSYAMILFECPQHYCGKYCLCGIAGMLPLSIDCDHSRTV